MGKIYKGFLLLVVLSMITITLPINANGNFENYKSSDQVMNIVNNYDYKYISKLDNDKADLYKNAIKNVLSDSNFSVFEVNSIISKIDEFAARENGLPVFKLRGNFWDGKGITTDELGATIDVALIVLSGGGFGSAKAAIGSLISKYGQKGAVKMIVSKLTELGLGAFASKVAPIIPAIVNLTSPGKGIAEFIDSIDFYKNNGRINLWP